MPFATFKAEYTVLSAAASQLDLDSGQIRWNTRYVEQPLVDLLQVFSVHLFVFCPMAGSIAFDGDVVNSWYTPFVCRM